MAAEFHYCEDNGAATGSPARGSVRSGFGEDSNFATDVNWKDADDCTANNGTPYGNAPIPAGANSYTKYQYGKFVGSFNQILNVLWAHTSGQFVDGITLKGKVTSQYQTPATSLNAALTENMTNPININDGQSVLLSPNGPEDQSPSAALDEPGYTQYLATQLQAAQSAGPGDTGTALFTLRYDEN